MMWKRYLILYVLISIEILTSNVLYTYLYKWIEMQFYYEEELKEISPILEAVVSIAVQFFFTGILAVIMGLLSVTMLNVQSVLVIGYFCGGVANIMLAIYTRLARNSYSKVSTNHSSNARLSYILIMFLWITEPLKIIVFLQQFPIPVYFGNLIIICGIICGSREVGKVSAMILRKYLESNEGLFLPYLTSLISAGVVFTCMLLACAINHLLSKPKRKFYIFNLSQYFSLKKQKENRLIICKITIPEINAAIANQMKGIILITSPLIIFWIIYSILILTWEWQFISVTRTSNIEFHTIYPIVNLLNIILISVFYWLKKNRKIKWLSADSPDLKRILYGFILTAIAFIGTTAIQYRIEETTERRPDIGNGIIKLYNAISKPLQVNSTLTGETLINAWMHHSIHMSNFDKGGEMFTEFVLKIKNDKSPPFSGFLYAIEKESVAYVIHQKGNESGRMVRLENFEPINYGPYGIKNQFKATVIIFNVHLKGFLTLKHNKEVSTTIELPTIGETKILTFEPNIYQSYLNIYKNGRFIGNQKSEPFNMNSGAVYTIFTLQKLDGTSKLHCVTVYERSSFQDLFIFATMYLGSLGKTMVTISTNRFIYTESPGEVISFVGSVQFFYESISFLFVAFCVRHLTFTITTKYLLLFLGVFLIDGICFFIMTLKYLYIPWKVVTDDTETMPA